jgi:hypothetical protein
LRCRRTVREGRCQLRDTMPPTPIWPATAPLERGWRNPRKGYGRLPLARTGRRRDVEPVWRVSSVTDGPVRSSTPLCRHPEYCNAIPVTVGALDDKTSPSPPLCALRPSVSYTLKPAYGRRLKWGAPTQPPSKPPLGQHRTRHDACWEVDSLGRSTTPRHYTPYRHT